MAEILFVLSLLVVLVWAVIRAVLTVAGAEASAYTPARHWDPIASYVEENYGSHFQDTALPVIRSLRKR